MCFNELRLCIMIYLLQEEKEKLEKLRRAKEELEREKQAKREEEKQKLKDAAKKEKQMSRLQALLQEVCLFVVKL